MALQQTVSLGRIFVSGTGVRDKLVVFKIAPAEEG